MDAATKAVNYASIIFGSVLGASVGYIIYQRTMARARELEIEELEAGNAEGLAPVRNPGYNDIDDDDAPLMDPDDISLWDNSDRAEREGGYRDEFTDDEDVFASGDMGDTTSGKVQVKDGD